MLSFFTTRVFSTSIASAKFPVNFILIIIVESVRNGNGLFLPQTLDQTWKIADESFF